jgi:hypothetical protein
MAGYSGTPLRKKLGLKPGDVVAVIAPPGGPALPAEKPWLDPDLSARELASGGIDAVMWFATRRADLDARIDEVARALSARGGVWFCWPKKASKLPTDITEGTIREIVLPKGLVDHKVCAVDERWSGLRVVPRRASGRDVGSGTP